MSIRELVKGKKYELRVNLGVDPVTGRRRTVARVFNGGERAAKTAYAALVTEVSAGRHQGTETTFGDLLARWLDHIDPDRSPSTMVGYRRRVTKRIGPAL